MNAQSLIWRPILADKVRIGEVRRREVLLADLIVMNQLLDAQAANERAAAEKTRRR